MNARVIVDPPPRVNLQARIDANVRDLNKLRDQLEQSRANVLVLTMVLREISNRAGCALILGPDSDRFALLGIQDVAQRALKQ